VLRELSSQFKGFEVPDDRLNLNGGAVVVGHPLSAHPCHLNAGRGARYGVLGVCAGSGQGVAVLLENDQA
jgi:acetyl-CoA acetyltransferase